MAVADDVVVEDVFREETAPQTGTGLPMPDVQSTESLQSFRKQLVGMTGRYGITTLIHSVDALLRHKGLFDRSSATVQSAVQRLNGERSAAQKVGDTKRTAGYAAKRFYEGLDDEGLQAQAKIARLNHNMYEGREELITALVEWYNQQVGRG